MARGLEIRRKTAKRRGSTTNARERERERERVGRAYGNGDKGDIILKLN